MGHARVAGAGLAREARSVGIAQFLENDQNDAA